MAWAAWRAGRRREGRPASGGARYGHRRARRMPWCLGMAGQLTSLPHSSSLARWGARPRPRPPSPPSPSARAHAASRPRLLTPGRRGSSAQTPNCTVATASTAHACYTTSAPGFGAIGVVDTTAQEVDRPAASGGAQWAGRLRLRSVCTSPSQPTWWWTCGASHRDACNGYGRREAQRRSDSELPLVPLRNPVDDSS